MKKIGCLLGILVLSLLFSSSAFCCCDEEQSEERQESWWPIGYISWGINALKFDGLINFDGVIPDLRSLSSIQSEPASRKDIDNLGSNKSSS